MYWTFSGFDSSSSLLFRVYEIILEVSFFCLIYYLIFIIFFGGGEEGDGLFEPVEIGMLYFDILFYTIYMYLKYYVSLLFSL